MASKVAAARVDQPCLATEWDEALAAADARLGAGPGWSTGGKVHIESGAASAVGNAFEAEFGVRPAGTRVDKPKSRLSLFRFPELPKNLLDPNVNPDEILPEINDIACPVPDCTHRVAQQDIGEASWSFILIRMHETHHQEIVSPGTAVLFHSNHTFFLSLRVVLFLGRSVG